MSEPLVGNVLVAQSGGPTAVINASLAGVVNEALQHECMEEILGGLNGIEGILNEDLIDLADESQQAIRGLRSTPGSALGTCRFKLKRSQDFERVYKVFSAHNIRYFFYIGGNDSQDTAFAISQYLHERGWDCRVMGIPKTIDNDLTITDHTPGYGSAVKYVCTVVRELACDAESMGRHDLVSILEVMGRSTGWIAAGASLAKRREHPNDPPHLIYLPEVPFQPSRFLEDVARVLKNERYCLIVAGEGLVDENGNYLATSGSAQDSFGHLQLGGVGDYLRGLVEEHLRIRSRAAKLGIGQRAAAHCASQTDNDEAFLVGRKAVEAAINGVTDKMITLLRTDSDHYTVETGLADLNEVANGVKTVPVNWINEDKVSLNFQFSKYALPLIQGEAHPPYENGVPLFVRLHRTRVPKTLEPHTFE